MTLMSSREIAGFWTQGAMLFLSDSSFNLQGKKGLCLSHTECRY